MNIAQIENNLKQVVQTFNKSTFIYELLLAYGQPKASITRLQKGGLNLSKIPGEIAWKKKLFFKEVNGEDLHDLIDNAANNEKATKHDPRFLIVTDYNTLLAVDRKTNDTLDISLSDIAKHFDFFLPWAGMEKAQHQNENPADVKAAEKMARLYDEIKKDNPTRTEEEVHNLNVFLSRLLFCFFAEDTGIFEKTQFTNAIASHTQQDGSDLHSYLDNLFEVMNTENDYRKNLSAYLEAFPYVNGGLFRNKHSAPVFTKRSRQTLIECGSLQWKDIHPDIFGSMIQAVVKPEERGGYGMHYTSVPNIMKVIKPLFLDELYEEFEAASYEPKRLIKLLERISRIKVFDPACGSGNFLIIAYKELRLLEIKIFQQLQNLQKAATGFEPKQMELIPKAQLTLAASYQHSMFSRVELFQFFGIEIDDFAHEIAILSLWLAQHQMNMKFKEIFGTANPTLPLQSGGNIVHNNATRIAWEVVCPKNEGDEIYILGNPPYKGFSQQKKSQKEDLNFLLGGTTKLDYIVCWFLIGAKYIKGVKAKLAFVSTNSICQGEQVALLWPTIFNQEIEIKFCHQSFKWSNNAKKNAGVTCVIIGLANKSPEDKVIYINNLMQKTKEINAYLAGGKNIIIEKRTKPISNFPLMVLGNMPYDFGVLHFSEQEKNSITVEQPGILNFLKPIVGSHEFINSYCRWCLWITDEMLEDAMSISIIRERIEENRVRRKKSKDPGVQKLANIPHQFREMRMPIHNSIIVPGTSSERRNYIPVGFLDNKTIINNLAFAIYDAAPYILGILSSRIHIEWIKAVCGCLETRIRYSSILGYNTFPFPIISDIQKQELERHVFSILEEREHHSEKTFAQLYDPDKMPASLKEAHHQLDIAVERCYRSKPFESGEERLEYLFKLYEQMIAEEKQRSGELIFEQPKLKKKRK